MKEEALGLLKAMENGFDDKIVIKSVIRRLVEELDRLDYDLKALVKLYKELNKTKPLSDEEIHDIWKSLWEGGNIGHIAYNYARAIEERHGIK